MCHTSYIFKKAFVSELHVMRAKVVIYPFIFPYSQRVGKRKVKKILYDKYVPMLAIRDCHVDNHFSDTFVPLYHVDYFVNGTVNKIVMNLSLKWLSI